VEDDKSNWRHRLPKVNFEKKILFRHMRKAEGVTVRHARKFIIRRIDNIREVRRRIITWTIAIGLLIGATGLQLVWYQQNYRTEAIPSSGTYAEAVLGPADTLDPLFASSSAEQSASSLLFSRLYNYDTSGHLGGDLASSMTIDTTGKIYTVKIRPDAKWHDGLKVSAKDVAFTVGLLQNPAVHSTITVWSNISVAVLDDETITFTLPAVYAAFAHALTFPILPEHILSKVEPNALRSDVFSDKPIGSGPFKLLFVQNVDTTGHKIIHMERNSSYYKGSSKLDRFQLHVYSDRGAILRALSSAEVNAATDLTASDVNQVDTERYNINTAPIKSGVYALLNTSANSLKDKIVRQALQEGTDTVAIRNQLPSGAPELDLPFTTGQLSGDVPKAPSYNPEAAGKLLDEAGWILDGSVRKKDGVELKLRVTTTKDNDYEHVLEVLAGQWRELGVVVDTVVLETSESTQGLVQNTLQQRDFDVLLYQLIIGADPDVYAYWHSSQVSSRGFNLSNYTSVISDDALSSARSRLEPGLRNAKYLTFARQWIADVPAIGLYQSTVHYVYSKNVTPFKSTNSLVTSIDRYEDVLYWSVGSQTVFKTP
jgi:peptide/nickel transport system substrate-binding protein